MFHYAYDRIDYVVSAVDTRAKGLQTPLSTSHKSVAYIDHNSNRDDSELYISIGCDIRMENNQAP